MKNYQMKDLFLTVVLLFVAIHAEASGTYQNAVIKHDCPDPGVFYDKKSDLFVAVTTTSKRIGPKGGYFPIYSSKDLANWTFESFAFPEGSQPSWSIQSYWAPEIHQILPNKYHMYFTAMDKGRKLCLGVAVSDNWYGPYEDPIGRPLLKNVTIGSLDPNIMKVNNETYLVWKVEGNAKGLHTDIKAVKLTPDGTLISEEDEPKLLITNDLEWEGPIIEGPWHLHRPPYHYIFYSANIWADGRYRVGVARSRDPFSSYEKSETAIMVSSDVWKGPGHCSVVKTRANKYVMVYHAWPNVPDRTERGRYMMIDEVLWSEDGWPYFKNKTPSSTKQ
ncbi:hypothetical protein AKO1_001305, partial [Acrasis kona]